MSSALQQTGVAVPTMDLKRYASEAILPRMRYENRSYNGTNPRSPSERRALRSVHKISRDEFSNRVTSYFKARPPSDFSRSSENWSPRVPHVNYPSIPDAGVLPAEDEKGVQTWVEQVALQTALCLLHSAEPELLNLEFGHPSARRALSDVVFRMANPRGSLTSKVNTLLVEVKCPWTLSCDDMQKISCVGDGLPPPSSTQSTTWDSARSVLAQVYDYCTEQKHCFWVITNYDYWVFGVFSADYETALATDPIPYDNASPTVLQCIVYWLQSSTFRAGAFEIPKALGSRFAVPCSRSLWTATLRLWRARGLKELKQNFALAGYQNPDGLHAECAESLERRNQSVGLDSTWYGDNLLGTCRSVLRLLGRPSDNLQWTVVFTWLALLLDPVSVTSDPDLPSLAAAFETASREEVHRPNFLLYLEGQGSSFHFQRARSIEPTPPRIWCPGDAVRREQSLEVFYWSHTSSEVAFILDKHLPPPIQNQLEEMLAKLHLLDSTAPEPQAEGWDSSGSRQPEEAAPERQVRAHQARSPSGPGRSGASTIRASSGLLQDNGAPWMTSPSPEGAPGPSSASRVAVRPSNAAFATYRSNSSSIGSPATPQARRAPNGSLFSSSSELTPDSDSPTGSPFWYAGINGDEDRVTSLADRLGGLAIQSPRSDSSRGPPRSIERSPLSARHDGEDGGRNPFFEPLRSSTRPVQLVNDSPRQSRAGRSEWGSGDGLLPDDEGRADTDEVSGNSLVEEIKSDALLDHLRNHPDDDVTSFEELVRQNKVSEEVLSVIASILSHSSTL